MHDVVFLFQLQCPRWVWKQDPGHLDSQEKLLEHLEMVMFAQNQTGRLGNALHTPWEVMHHVSVLKKVLSRFAVECGADYRNVLWQGRPGSH